MNELLLAHDIGTSGTKSSLVRPDGAVFASASSPHGTHSPRPQWVEQDADDWWAGVCRNTRALLDKHPDAKHRVAGIGVSGHMLGCLPVDAQGRPLRRALIHSDCRATAQFAAIEKRIGADRIYRATGNILDPRSPLCKLLWVKETEAALYQHAVRFLQSKDYIVARLTGNLDSTDASDASHAQLYDVRAKSYCRDVLDELGLETAKLPTVHRGTAVVGQLTAAELGLTAGIPVVAGGGDGACATAGAGVVNVGEAYCCLGSTAWIAGVAAAPVIDPHRRIFNIVALDGETCGVYGTVQAAGTAVDWAMKLFGETDFSRLAEAVASVAPGSDGLIFLPYLEGERSPIFDANARGVFFGITPGHGRAQFLRAALEGVSFALRSVLDVFRETHPAEAVRLIGGGARSVVWRQLLADVWNAEVQLLSAPPEDATSLGAALAAGVGVGLFPTLPEAVRSIRVAERYRPDAARANRYRGIFPLYAALYPALKSAYALRAKTC